MGSDTCLGADQFLSTLERSIRRVCSHGIFDFVVREWIKLSKAPVSTGTEYTFPDFTLAADDNKFIKSDKSYSWTHYPLSPLLKIIADNKADKTPNEKDRERVKELKYGDIIVQFQFLTYFRQNVALSTISF